MNQNRFYKGNRVRYTSTLMPLCTGKEGEVVGQRGGLVQVLFDGETFPTGCYEVSLLKLRRENITKGA